MLTRKECDLRQNECLACVLCSAFGAIVIIIIIIIIIIILYTYAFSLITLSCQGCLCRHKHKFHFFCKYYAAMMISLCGCIILGKDIPVIQEWSPLYVMITVIVVMSEKVDTTITKGQSITALLCSSSTLTWCAHCCWCAICTCLLLKLLCYQQQGKAAMYVCTSGYVSTQRICCNWLHVPIAVAVVFMSCFKCLCQLAQDFF